MSETSPARPPAEFVPAVRELAARLVEIVRPAARACGYAVAVHGSMARDLDLVAVPWTEDATDALAVVKAIQDAISAQLDTCYRSKDPDDTKPHGRVAWTLFFHDAVSTPNGAFPFIDLSVMPRSAKP